MDESALRTAIANDHRVAEADIVRRLRTLQPQGVAGARMVTSDWLRSHVGGVTELLNKVD